MGSKISCGEIEQDFSYILYTIIFNLLYDLVYGFNYNLSFEDVILFNNKLSIHKLVRYFFNYASLAIFNAIVYCKSSKQHELGNDSSKGLIYYNAEEEMKSNEVTKTMIRVILLWILEEHSIAIMHKVLKDLDFWMIELLFENIEV